MLEFEDFLFGRDRVALERIAEGLLDLQGGTCFYCHTPIGRNREIDHFIPWTYSGDDGIDNLVAACHRCNNSKRAILAGPEHLAEIIRRTKPGARTSPHCPSSGAGHATPSARTGSPAPPIYAPPAGDSSGYAPEPE